MPARELRPYQVDALRAIRDTVGQGVRRLVVQAPTGAGKTRVAADIVEGAQRKGNRLAFVVSSISLVDQTVEAFYAEGIRDVGVIQANHERTDWSKPVQVCSIQTVHSRKAYPEAQVVVIDECHVLHKAHVKWMIDPAWEKVPFIGLSATPWTKGLGKYFESLLVMSRTDELIKEGYLSPFRVYAADHPDLSNVKIVLGDYHEGQLSAVMRAEGLTANVIETWRSRWNKDKTLCFGVDCAHAQALQARFHDAGISCGYQDANTPSAERAVIKRKFHSGEYRVVCNVGTLTTGVDWDVRCLILARPTKSEMLFVQIIGRSLRTAEGKEHAIILDHTDTTSRLGFVTDIHHEMLDGGRLDTTKKILRKPALPKPCPQCTCLIPVGAKTCPACGFERKIISDVHEREGQLVEIEGYSKKKAPPRGKGQTNDRLFPYSAQEKMRFFAQLRGYALMKGYAEGWAAHKFKSKFYDWPPRQWKNVTPMTPGPEVVSYIRSQMIAWINSKAAQDEAKRRERPAGGAGSTAT
jgi:DNA repair protein RadD